MAIRVTEQMAALSDRLADQGLVAAAMEHARSAFPLECCGFLLEREDGVLYYLPVDNLCGSGDRSMSGPRGGVAGRREGCGRYRFEADTLPLLGALLRGERLRVIAHSHPDGDVGLSATDREMILCGSTGGHPPRPWFDDCFWLVVGLGGRHLDREPEARLFRYDRKTARFAEVARYDGNGERVGP